MGKYEWIMVMFVVALVILGVYVLVGPEVSELTGAIAGMFPTPTP